VHSVITAKLYNGTIYQRGIVTVVMKYYTCLQHNDMILAVKSPVTWP